MTSAVPTTQIDNGRVRVTEWRFAPGAATGHHQHRHDYVVVPMTTGKLLLKGWRRRRWPRNPWRDGGCD